MKLERYRPTMTAEVLHSWAADADAEIERLRGLLANAALQVVRADTGRAQIVAAERERCAKLCEELKAPSWVETSADMREALAEAIRTTGSAP